MRRSSPAVLVCLALAAPGRAPAQAAPREAGDTLIAGGDTVLCRWEHDYAARAGSDWPLAGVAPLLQEADGALCNLECAVSLLGVPAPKGERCPFYYRARPEMLAVLVRAGIDLVTAANNHVGDYGPDGVRETLRWTAAAGLVCVGIGADLEQAERPRFFRVGGTRIALAGLDTTMPYFRAAPGRPGSNHLPPGAGLEPFRAFCARLRAAARGRADLVALTIHWGDNWVREVPGAHREIAAAAVEHGIDLILGHSAHRLQGIEVIGGKPVLYDMGNLLFDCELRPEGRRSALFRLRLSPAGVRRVEIVPVQAMPGFTRRAAEEEAAETLDELRRLSEPLGTRIEAARDAQGRRMGVIELAPAERDAGPQGSPSGPPAPIAGFPAARPFAPPRATSVVVPELPADAVRLVPPRPLAPGVELLGFRLPEAAAEGAILTAATWWRVTEPVAKPWLVSLRLETAGRVLYRGSEWYNRHDPGDWLLPLSSMQPGEIVEDRFPCRLAGLPPGPCGVDALVLDPDRPEHERRLGPLFRLGTVALTPREGRPKEER